MRYSSDSGDRRDERAGTLHGSGSLNLTNRHGDSKPLLSYPHLELGLLNYVAVASTGASLLQPARLHASTQRKDRGQ